MRSPVANWTTENTATQKPVIYIDPGTKKFLSLNARFSKMGTVSLTSNEKQYLINFNLKLPKINFLKGGSQAFGSIDFEIMDIQTDAFAFPVVTNEIFNASYFQKTVRSYFGFEPLAFGKLNTLVLLCLLSLFVVKGVTLIGLAD